jgi:hypothetical protein
MSAVDDEDDEWESCPNCQYLDDSIPSKLWTRTVSQDELSNARKYHCDCSKEVVVGSDADQRVRRDCSLELT